MHDETAISPARLEVFKQLFQAVAEEMGEVLMRTGYSPNIKERRDYSCAVFDGNGETIAQAEHLPVHLGSMPQSVAAALAAHTLAPGDIVMLNDPYQGGTHLPDVTLVAPVYIDGSVDARPAFYVANRAHHADVGGIAPGSLSLARELYQEGIILPPVKIARRGTIDDDLLNVFLRNVRTPEERRGDLLAQVAANRIGAQRLQQYVARYGVAEVARYGRALQDYAERVVRALLAEIPDGEVRSLDYLDDDGLGGQDFAIALTMRVAGEGVTFDFTGSAPQMPGSLNAVAAITLSAVAYALRLAIREDVPTNAGTFRPISLIVPEGSIVQARPPAAVAGGNVETSQRIVDVALAALAQVLPDRIPAASQGTMNNITFGPANGGGYAYYETIGGGAGGGPGWHGSSGVQVHMTNTLNTPVEALERSAPVRIERYALREGSGGVGRYHGGEGIIRTYHFLDAVEVSVLSERRRHRPYGLHGGQAGQPGANTLRTPDGQEEALPAKFRRILAPGSRLTITTPGGGGWGTPASDSAEEHDAPA